MSPRACTMAPCSMCLTSSAHPRRESSAPQQISVRVRLPLPQLRQQLPLQRRPLLLLQLQVECRSLSDRGLCGVATQAQCSTLDRSALPPASGLVLFLTSPRACTTAPSSARVTSHALQSREFSARHPRSRRPEEASSQERRFCCSELDGPREGPKGGFFWRVRGMLKASRVWRAPEERTCSPYFFFRRHGRNALLGSTDHGALLLMLQ
mmetsp:Transcript_21377/g.49725  ORF Transcript_21377/g.49725 Transcript_21377/m.49725 type:complete len:209 (+) Transcript_21377:885-1511(+)